LPISEESTATGTRFSILQISHPLKSEKQSWDEVHLTLRSSESVWQQCLGETEKRLSIYATYAFCPGFPNSVMMIIVSPMCARNAKKNYGVSQLASSCTTHG
jgi:hypothetical protein